MLAMILSALLAQCPTCGPQGCEARPPRPVLRMDRVQQDAALAEVNAARAARGLPPFAFDAGLTVAAQRCAQLRAQQLLFGHLPNDFAHVPPGVFARASGCAAWEPSWGWGSCCMYDVGYQHAGAAWALGRDGKRYMHLFVR